MLKVCRWRPPGERPMVLIDRYVRVWGLRVQDPVTGIVAHPAPSNILEWHYIVEGAAGTPYEGGVCEFSFGAPSRTSRPSISTVVGHAIAVS